MTTRDRAPSDHDPARRALLRLGLTGAAGLALGGWPRLLRAEEPGAAPTGPGPRREGRARAVIQVFLPGGLAQQDSFDPKPHSPLEYRGETAAIPTRLDGVQFGSLLPRTAQVADRLTVVRSMTHDEAAHERGVHNAFTGSRPSPALVYPSMGSVVAQLLGPRADLPPYVCIPGPPTPYAGPGYLSSAVAPFAVGGEPSARDFKVRDLTLPPGVDAARFARRRALLAALEGDFAAGAEVDAVAGLAAFRAQAYALLDAPAARAAFDLGREPDKVKDAYGRDAAGMRLLLARRLAEAGVRWTTVSWGGWDHHDQIHRALRGQLPTFDRAFAALVADLERRGLLDTTLVLVTTEFGRTPKLNQTQGRDHWPKVFSQVLAGGGARRGHVHGASDATAAEPEEAPVSIEDWAATVFHLVGLAADTRLVAPGDRPIELVRGGRVRRELLA